MNLGPHELLIIAAIVLLLFGAGRVERFARSLGKARRELQAGLDDES